MPVAGSTLHYNKFHALAQYAKLCKLVTVLRESLRSHSQCEQGNNLLATKVDSIVASYTNLDPLASLIQPRSCYILMQVAWPTREKGQQTKSRKLDLYDHKARRPPPSCRRLCSLRPVFIIFGVPPTIGTQNIVLRNIVYHEHDTIWVAINFAIDLPSRQSTYQAHPCEVTA